MSTYFEGMVGCHCREWLANLFGLLWRRQTRLNPLLTFFFKWIKKTCPLYSECWSSYSSMQTTYTCREIWSLMDLLCLLMVAKLRLENCCLEEGSNLIVRWLQDCLAPASRVIKANYIGLQFPVAWSIVLTESMKTSHSNTVRPESGAAHLAPACAGATARKQTAIYLMNTWFGYEEHDTEISRPEQTSYQSRATLCLFWMPLSAMHSVFSLHEVHPSSESKLRSGPAVRCRPLLQPCSENHLLMEMCQAGLQLRYCEAFCIGYVFVFDRVSFFSVVVDVFECSCWLCEIAQSYCTHTETHIIVSTSGWFIQLRRQIKITCERHRNEKAANLSFFWKSC